MARTVRAGYRSCGSGSWGRAANGCARGTDFPQWKGDRPSAIGQSTGEDDPELSLSRLTAFFDAPRAVRGMIF
jgi:hypothetical protein